MGDVRNARTGKLRAVSTREPYGYKHLTLCKNSRRKDYFVHRLVALAFIGECPDGMEVAHANGNARDCSLANLRYATRAENIADKIAHGRQPRGSVVKQSVLSEDVVRFIKAANLSSLRLGPLLGVCPSTVRAARRGTNWAHVA